jgi:hypothetical protein
LYSGDPLGGPLGGPLAGLFALILLALALSYFSSRSSISLIVLHQLVMFFGPPIFKAREA